MIFDWDEANITHLARHDVTPAEAEQVHLNGPLDIEVQQDENDVVRVQQVGETNTGRILVLVSTWRIDRVRVITGWNAPRADKLLYLKRRADNEWLIN